MKTNFLIMTLTLLSPSPLWAQGKPPVAVTCQLDTTDDSKVYSMDVVVDPAKNLFKLKIVSWNPDAYPNKAEVVVEKSNHSYNGEWSDVVASGEEEGSKSLLLKGESFFITRADQKKITESFVVNLVQGIHPDDGTRAAGAIFLGVDQLESKKGPLLPDGVTLAGPGNCWKSSGLDAYL